MVFPFFLPRLILLSARPNNLLLLEFSKKLKGKHSCIIKRLQKKWENETALIPVHFRDSPWMVTVLVLSQEIHTKADKCSLGSWHYNWVSNTALSQRDTSSAVWQKVGSYFWDWRIIFLPLLGPEGLNTHPADCTCTAGNAAITRADTPLLGSNHDAILLWNNDNFRHYTVVFYYSWQFSSSFSNPSHIFLGYLNESYYLVIKD